MDAASASYGRSGVQRPSSGEGLNGSQKIDLPDSLLLPTLLNVKPFPGTLRDGGASFVTTRWSVVGDCASNTELSDTALSQLCRDYWPPLYSFARRRGYSPADAQDLVQGFFASFLQSRAYARSDRHKGKFRSFMLASLKHYMANAWHREHALKRGGGREFVPLAADMESVESLYASELDAPAIDEERDYEERWAAALVACALARLAAEWEGPKRRLFLELKPFLCGGAELPGQEEISRRLEMPINTLRSHLSRLRARYGQLLREEVTRTIGRDDDVEEELRHLRKLLRLGSA